ncbi:MAG: hypothetical protein U0441_22455 [Polyangiaceae bacterium]
MTAYRSGAATNTQRPATALSPIANMEALFPRPHPSASTVRLLGLLALVTGPLAGLPAIVLGRVVERESARTNGRLIGAPPLFVHLGWAGTYAGLFLGCYFIAASSVPVAMGFVGLGALAGLSLAVGGDSRAPRAISAWNALVRRSPVLIGAPIAGVLLSGAAGYVTKKNNDERARAEAEERCRQGLLAADRGIGAEDFPAARQGLVTARETCVGPVLDSVAEKEALFQTRESAARKRHEEEAAAERARAAEQHEKDLADSRARTQLDAEESLRKAEAFAAQRRWEDAEQELRGADKAVSSLRDLHASSDVLEPLEKRITALRTRIAPGLEQARKLREAQEAAEERRRAAQAAAEERRRAAQEAAAAAREAASESSGLLYCRDGSVSGCACAGSHRGCCSHHGGVAGCR